MLKLVELANFGPPSFRITRIDGETRYAIRVDKDGAFEPVDRETYLDVLATVRVRELEMHTHLLDCLVDATRSRQ